MNAPAHTNRAAWRRLCRSIAWAAVVVVLLSACQTLPFGRDDAESTPEPERPTADAGSSIGEAIADLQDGRVARARRTLENLLADDPDNVTGRLLMRQIEQSPESILGSRFEQVEVRAGESLSLLADRHAGNPLLFHALARLNDIERPRLLRPGQQLRVPAAAAVEASPKPGAPDVPATDGDVQIEPTEQPTPDEVDRSWDSLLADARGGRLGAAGAADLANAAVELAAAARREGDLERAVEVLDQTEPWLGESERPQAYRQERAIVEAELAVLEADALVERGRHSDAFDLLRVHGAFGSGDLVGPGSYDAVPPDLVERLRDHFHEDALVAWRGQRVDESVELWERVLVIDPEFEPARAYLERARRVQRELDSMSGG